MTSSTDRQPGDSYIDDEDRDAVVDPDFTLIGRYLQADQNPNRTQCPGPETPS
jgi:hypothetical protein